MVDPKGLARQAPEKLSEYMVLQLIAKFPDAALNMGV